MTQYTTLAKIEARYGIDFNDGSGNPNYPFSPTDGQIYTASSDCMVTSASALIDKYLGTTLSTATTAVEEACNRVVMRMIQERFIILQLMGVQSISDEWGTISSFAGTFEIMTPEIQLLLDEDRELAVVINTS